MKLSDNTLSVLKNYANINQNLLITAGSTLSTMSVQKNIFAKAEISETFDRDVAIYDLNEFLASVTGMSDPDLDFKDDFILVTNNNGDKLEFYYSDPSVVSSPTTEITMPNAEITFTLSNEQLSDIVKMAAIIGAADMVLENGKLTVTDKKNKTANNYSKNVNAKVSEVVDYKFWFKVENLKLLSGTYDVSISSKKISYFKNQNIDIGYFIALEPESYYG
jgi:hypothetical protein|tara:strand:- start:10 stop:669 length:660 start_codon:yes stop_codon:yes gene_type:complete